MRTKSAAAQNNHERERALSLELAEKGARELQESFESAVRGEDGGDDKEDNGGGNGNGNDSSDEDEDGEGDDDRGGDTAAMDVHAPGSSASTTASLRPHFSDAPCLDHTVSSAKAWVSVACPGKSVMAPSIDRSSACRSTSIPCKPGERVGARLRTACSLSGR